MPKRLEECEVRLKLVTEELEQTKSDLTKLKTSIKRVMFRTMVVTVIATVSIAIWLYYL
ncbi:hypothetical protein AGENTSMITH_20 [Bacillus phage vB_BspM_AgentSmith]|nr:hypothetical protein AGENTSMITH_20 [Bacillus phage vB_BspM_AgentSmith]